MFSLIITIISIALVAALALATIYYGGSSFNKGSAEAVASQYINEGQQINGAVAMARADFASGTLTAEVGTVAGLATAYLAQVPAKWDQTVVTSGTATGTLVRTEAATAGVCAAVNKKAGFADGAAVTLGAGSYGCVAADAWDPVAGDSRIVYFKF